VDKKLSNFDHKLSHDFIAGLIVGEGTFYWTKSGSGRVPAFAIRLHVRDKELITAVRDSLGLRERIYEYTHNNRHYVMLIVRNIGSLKNVIIPIIYPRLAGYKRLQFLRWFREFFSPDIAPAFAFFPNALRHRFPELCQIENLPKMTEAKSAPGHV
jgi:hypothetical protein